MTQSNSLRDRDLFTRIAQVEYRLSKIENAQAELESTMTPGGYITEAFERGYEDIERLDNKIEILDGKIDSVNSKIDIIMRHITCMNS
jgi:chaperonin cofactor prefoldin